MLKKILPENIYNILNNYVNFDSINEIRLRANKPIVLSIKGKRIFLGEKGVTSNLNEAIKISKIAIEDIIFRASECSIYSVNEQIKKGFIVMDGGIRLGLGGDLIQEGNIVKTMTNFNSINLRIPHEIKNCSLEVFDYLMADNFVYNTLIIAPPGAGKTTLLRDFICQLSERNYAFNVLVLDERGELDIGKINSLGNFTDKISFAKKSIGFENGIRSLSPNLIVTDELGTKEDVDSIIYAVNCGVNVMASIHCENIDSLFKKPFIDKLLNDKCFNRYVLLSMKNGPGTIEAIYNENFSRLK